ncbi:transmembrane protein 30C [Corythoichthys intestinalis]|uniref:transmembrane protein 30C n=1 Tax=Corythoichthys intestinalis TaxID=161448 RepID=UPI0025A6478A|nr:transmembrane protein 30C [Corythoichthys intestinalis]XP_061799920.1 cell cycle control protein 50C-like [Nerophis lumbriciformis]
MAKAKSGPLARRPDNSAFKQQRLPAWSPMLTANTVLPFFYFMALICLLLGIWLLLTVQSVQEIRVDYTDNGRCAFCHDMRKNASNAAVICTCELHFQVSRTLKGDVFFYYGLQNFHQNLRRYMDSRDDAQMVGRKKNLKKPSSYCKPFSTNDKGLPIAPCGAVANSIFNDTFKFHYLGSGNSKYEVPLLRKGISWYTDKNVKYRNPRVENLSLTEVFEGTAPPPYWQKPAYELDKMDPNNNGFINEDLIVWMREAAFPNFKKLYGILQRADKPFQNGLPKGNYSVTITYNFPVQYFQGRKQVVLTTLNWFGGPNQFLPIAYLITSCLILVTAVGLTVVWWKFGKDGKNMDEL